MHVCYRKGDEKAPPCKSIADGALRYVLETLEISFAGSSEIASRLACEKLIEESMTFGIKIAVLEFVVLPQSTFRELGAPAVMHVAC